MINFLNHIRHIRTYKAYGYYHWKNYSSNNFIHSLSVNSNTGFIAGIKISWGSGTYSNNIIKLGNNNPATIYGIYEVGGVSNIDNIYFNTIYINGSVGSGTEKSYCLYSNSSNPTRDFRNNIFSNARSTTGGSNLHYAAYYNYAVNINLTNDYNDYFANGTGGVLGYYNGANTNSCPIVTGNDVNSLNANPQFANAGGLTATDYVPATILSGITISGQTMDYAATIRQNPPTMGAFEYLVTSTVWIGPEPAHWTNGAPTATINATIDWLYNENINIVCKDLTINNAKNLEIQPSYNVTVNGNLLNNGSVILVSPANLNPSGSLIVNGTITNNGTMRGDRYITPNRYHFMATPLDANSLAINSFSQDYVWTYNESYNGPENDDAWDAITSVSETIKPGIGYLVKSSPAYNTNFVIPFAGTFRTGNFSLTNLPLSFEGYNLVGNPYPSAIDWNLVTKSNVSATYWLWKSDGVTEYSGVYATWNGST